MGLELKIWGTRGAMARASKEYLEYGGNTSSITVRTPEKTLMFLDAGTGIMPATAELNQPAEKVILGISHTHADHIMGLGMSGIPYTCFRPWYQGKKVQLMGPPGIVRGMQQFYDGELNCNADTEYVENKCWPVAGIDDVKVKPNMPGIDFGNALELQHKQTYDIDDKTKLDTFIGNHPVKGGSVFYRINANGKSLVYAVDNEFDWLTGPVPNENAAQLKEAYIAYVKDADILLADAQYTTEEYLSEKPVDVRGFGHSHIEQIIDLAAKAGVKKVMPTHHGARNDAQMSQIEERAKEYISKCKYTLDVVFAKEGMIITL